MKEFPKSHYVHFLRMIMQRISRMRQSQCTQEQLHIQHINSSITRQYVKHQSPSSSTVKSVTYVLLMQHSIAVKLKEWFR
jgi:hypothetical protein